MKKLLCALLMLCLLLMTFAAAEETDDEYPTAFYLYERRMTVTEDNRCILQLRLFKEGGIQYCLDEMDIVLLDAEDREIVPLSTKMIAPINPVPAGDQFFHVTMIYELPEGAEPEKYHIAGVPGEAYAEPSAEPLELGSGHILMHTKDGPAATCWLEKPATEMRHSGHMMLLHIYDVEDAYLGTQAFSWEDAVCEVSGTQARSKLAELSGLTEEVLDYYELDFNPQSSYYFFADVPLTGLLKDDIPASASAETYRTKSPLLVLASSFERLEDGSLRAYCLLQNGACEPIDFNGHHVSIYNEAGENGWYYELGFDCALWELEPFGFTAMQYTFKGVDADFVPVSIEVSGRVIHKEAPYTVKKLTEEHYEISHEDGKMFVTATIPYELCEKTLSNNLSSCSGLIWYARNPEDSSMISCGSVGEYGEDSVRVGSWTRYKPIEITGIPEGVTPEILIFFIDEK